MATKNTNTAVEFKIDDEISKLNLLEGSESELNTLLSGYNVNELDQIAEKINVAVSGNKVKKVNILKQYLLEKSNTDDKKINNKQSLENDDETAGNDDSNNKTNQPLSVTPEVTPNSDNTDNQENQSTPTNHEKLKQKANNLLEMLAKVEFKDARVNLMGISNINDVSAIANIYGFILDDEEWQEITPDDFEELDSYLENEGEYKRILDKLPDENQDDTDTDDDVPVYQTTRIKHDLRDNSIYVSSDSEFAATLYAASPANYVLLPQYTISGGTKNKVQTYKYLSVNGGKGISVVAMIGKKSTEILRVVLNEKQNKTYSINVENKEGSELIFGDGMYIQPTQGSTKYYSHKDFVLSYLLPSVIRYRIEEDCIKTPNSVQSFALLITVLIDRAVKTDKQLKEKDKKQYGKALLRQPSLEDISRTELIVGMCYTYLPLFLSPKCHGDTEFIKSVHDDWLAIPENYRLEAAKRFKVSHNLTEQDYIEYNRKKQEQEQEKFNEALNKN